MVGYRRGAAPAPDTLSSEFSITVPTGPPPTLTNIAPNNAVPGTFQVVLTGTNFSSPATVAGSPALDPRLPQVR